LLRMTILKSPLDFPKRMRSLRQNMSIQLAGGWGWDHDGVGVYFGDAEVAA
jgi:hypothetical protein